MKTLRKSALVGAAALANGGHRGGHRGAGPGREHG
jgi:hypothetical protein